MKVAVTGCLLPNWFRIHLPTGSISVKKTRHKRTDSNTCNGRAGWVRQGHGPVDPIAQPGRVPLAARIQFIVSDNLREGLLPNLPLDSVCNDIHCEWVGLRTSDDSSDVATTPSHCLIATSSPCSGEPSLTHSSP